MKNQSFLILQFIFIIQVILRVNLTPHNYPTILFCGLKKVPVIHSCEWRSEGRNKPLEDCHFDFIYNQTFTVLEGSTRSSEYCTIVNTKAHLQARDRYSIVTFTTEALTVEHIAVFQFGSTLPSTLDGLIDFIYVYDASALITFTGVTKAEDGIPIYGVSLHTHFRPNPPQYLWFRFDPLFNDNITKT